MYNSIKPLERACEPNAQKIEPGYYWDITQDHRIIWDCSELPWDYHFATDGRNRDFSTVVHVKTKLFFSFLLLKLCLMAKLPPSFSPFLVMGHGQ